MQFGLGCSSAQRCRGKVRFLISYTLGICLALSCKRWPQTGFSGLELRLHCNAWCQVTDKMVSTFNLSLAAARPLMVMMKRRRGQADSRPAHGPDFNRVRASSIKQVKINPLYLIESWTQRLNVAHAHCLFWRLRQRSGISSIGPPHGRFTLSVRSEIWKLLSFTSWLPLAVKSFPRHWFDCLVAGRAIVSSQSRIANYGATAPGRPPRGPQIWGAST